MHSHHSPQSKAVPANPDTSSRADQFHTPEAGSGRTIFDHLTRDPQSSYKGLLSCQKYVSPKPPFLEIRS